LVISRPVSPACRAFPAAFSRYFMYPKMAI
jgi:hypothetical protein